MRARRLLLAALLLIAGCTTVPLSTIWKLRSFGPEQLVALNPKELRAAARVDSRVTMSGVMIVVEVEPAAGAPKRRYELKLDAPQREDPRLERAPAGRRWFVFALSPQGVEEFERIKREYASIPKGSRGTVSVSAEEGFVPPELQKKFPVRTDLLLEPADGYFTLIRETDLDLTESENKK
jgi:hypothetical protein